VATSVVVVLAALRTIRALRTPGPSGPLVWAQAFAVSTVYDVARALALVVRRRHRRVR
jgi:hypothetical protein